MNAFIKR